MKTANDFLRLARRAARTTAGADKWPAVFAALTADGSPYDSERLRAYMDRAPACTPSQYVDTLATLGTWDAEFVYRFGRPDKRARGESLPVEFSDVFDRGLRAPRTLDDLRDCWQLYDAADHVETDDVDRAPVIQALREQEKREIGDHSAAALLAADYDENAATACQRAVADRLESEYTAAAFDALIAFIEHCAPDAGVTVINSYNRTLRGSVWEAAYFALHYTAGACRENSEAYHANTDPAYWYDALTDLRDDAPRLTSHETDAIHNGAYYWAANDLAAALDLIENGGIETAIDELAADLRRWRARLPDLIRARVTLEKRQQIRRDITGLRATGKHDKGAS